MHAQIAAELKADGYAILSDDIPEKGQVGTRTGKPVSGKATSGESAPINYSSDKTLEPDKEPLSCPPDEGAQEAKRRKEGFREYRKGEFPEAFERLCAMSIKSVASLRFKRDCLAAWERRVETRRSVIRSQLAMGGSLPPEEEVLSACEEDGPYKRYFAACEERHERYLKVFEMFRNPSRGLERAQEEALTAGAMPFGGRLP